MHLSSNELDSTIRKAFRGAGYQWGEAEEAGKAAVWLAKRGLPAAPLAATLLASVESEGMAAHQPSIANRHWTGGSSGICPIRAGCALSDLADALRRGEEVRLEALRAPLLFLPFMSSVSVASAQPMSLTWEGCDLVIDGTDLLLGEQDGLISPSATAALRIMAQGQRPSGPVKREAPAVDVDQSSWDALNRFAARTYVPASEHSRQAGAGAGLTDND